MDIGTTSIVFGMAAQLVTMVVTITVFFMKIKSQTQRVADQHESDTKVFTNAVGELKGEFKLMSDTQVGLAQQMVKVSVDLGHVVRDVERVVELGARVARLEQTMEGVAGLRREYQETWRPRVDSALARLEAAVFTGAGQSKP